MSNQSKIAQLRADAADMRRRAAIAGRVESQRSTGALRGFLRNNLTEAERAQIASGDLGSPARRRSSVLICISSDDQHIDLTESAEVLQSHIERSIHTKTPLHLAMLISRLGVSVEAVRVHDCAEHDLE